MTVADDGGRLGGDRGNAGERADGRGGTVVPCVCLPLSSLNYHVIDATGARSSIHDVSMITYALRAWPSGIIAKGLRSSAKRFGDCDLKSSVDSRLVFPFESLLSFQIFFFFAAIFLCTLPGDVYVELRGLERVCDCCVTRILKSCP